jgi:hypothetical protein
MLQVRRGGLVMSKERIIPRDEPEVRRAKGRRYVDWCNKAVHKMPWVDGDMSTQGGVSIALKLAQQAYQTHALPYEAGLSRIDLYPPRRFAWTYDAKGECVKVCDKETGRLLFWPHF